MNSDLELELEDEEPELRLNGSQEVMEHVLFNMMQEGATTFRSLELPHGLKAVQPRELVDVKLYRNSFL
jgi:hypothetical protein